jgi:hypothetical protein
MLVLVFNTGAIADYQDIVFKSRRRLLALFSLVLAHELSI